MYFIFDNINNYNKNDYKNFYHKLKEKDKQKIKSLIYEKDKQLTILSRILLIKILQDNYNLDYNNLEIKYNKYNKPLINNIYFNISHSNEYAIVATSNNKIGIDIEKIRKVNINIINYFCTTLEKKYILNSNNHYKSLFEIFCLKEAYFKMLGTGITNLKEIEFKIIDNLITCNHPNLNIKLDYSINGYIIAIIENI